MEEDSGKSVVTARNFSDVETWDSSHAQGPEYSGALHSRLEPGRLEPDSFTNNLDDINNELA